MEAKCCQVNSLKFINKKVHAVNSSDVEEVVEEVITEEPTEPPAEENISEEIVEEPVVVDDSVEEIVIEDPVLVNETVEEVEEIIVEEPIINETVEEVVEEIIDETLEEEIMIEEPTIVEEEIVEETTANVIVEEEEAGILKTILRLVLGKFSVIKGQFVKIKAYLTYEDDTPVSNKEINFYAGEEKIGSDATNNQGLAKINWDTSPYPPGIYSIKADYEGDESSEGSSDIAEITIEGEIEPVMLTMNEATAGPLEKIQDCHDVKYEEREAVYGTCNRDVLVCTDEPVNSSCSTQSQEYDCFLGFKDVEKIRQDCTTIGYTLDNGVKQIQLNTDAYECSTELDGESVVAICDSKLDGNGDGKCSSGESCMKFVLNGESFEKYEKNSRDDFVPEDEKFFLERITAEVLQ